MLIPKMYVFISLPWIFDELHFKSRRFHVNFDYFTIWTNSGRNIHPISENIANWSLFAFSSFFLNRFSQKWRPLYGQKWQMAALNSIRMTNLDKSGPEALCDVIFRLSPYSWGGGHRKGHFIIVFRASVFYEEWTLYSWNLIVVTAIIRTFDFHQKNFTTLMRSSNFADDVIKKSAILTAF